MKVCNKQNDCWTQLHNLLYTQSLSYTYLINFYGENILMYYVYDYDKSRYHILSKPGL